MDDNSKKKFYTIAELVEAGFGSRTTIWTLIKKDNLPAYKIGGRVLIPRAAFEDYLAIHRIRQEV